MSAEAHLECLLPELLLSLTSRVRLLLRRQAKAGRLLPSGLSRLIGLEPELRAKLTLLLPKAESILLELLLSLPGRLLLLLCRQPKLRCALTSLLSSLIGLKPKFGTKLPLLLPEPERFLLELLLGLVCCFLLLLSRQPELCRLLAGSLACLECINLQRCLCLLSLSAKPKGALPHLLCLLQELLPCSAHLQLLLSLLEASCAIRLERLLRLLERLLTTTGLDVLKLLTKIALTLRLHDGFTIAAQSTGLRGLLAKLGSLNFRLPTSFPLFDIGNELLVGIHVLLERGRICNGPGLKATA